MDNHIKKKIGILLTLSNFATTLNIINLQSTCQLNAYYNQAVSRLLGWG